MDWTHQTWESQDKHVTEMGEMHMSLQGERGWLGLALSGNAWLAYSSCRADLACWSRLIDIPWQVGKTHFTANVKQNSWSDCDIPISDPHSCLKLDMPRHSAKHAVEVTSMASGFLKTHIQISLLNNYFWSTFAKGLWSNKHGRRADSIVLFTGGTDCHTF